MGVLLTGRPAFILITVEEETVGDKLSNGRIASYVSDKDPYFVPSDASAGSAEEDSEGEERKPLLRWLKKSNRRMKTRWKKL